VDNTGHSIVYFEVARLVIADFGGNTGLVLPNDGAG
jgi:hypothetical protein